MKTSAGKLEKKKDIRALILSAAKELFVKTGFESASIRRIAAEIGYSPTTIYLYYKDKGDIVYALHKEGFGILKSLFFPLANVEDPFERLKAIGHTYLNFSRQHPDYYEVMFMLRDPMDYLDSEVKKTSWEEGKQVFHLLVATIRECQQAGYFSSANAEYTALQAWALVHGLCSMYVTTRLEKVGEELFGSESSDILLESAFKTYVGFMEKTKVKSE